MFKCNECSKSFMSKSSLIRHFKSHSKQHLNKYNAKCLDCEMSFRYIKDLRIHLVFKHDFNGECLELEFNDMDGRILSK